MFCFLKIMCKSKEEFLKSDVFKLTFDEKIPKF